jgi:hypothetical protein
MAYAAPVEMRWRIRLDGAPPDLDRLRRELATGDVVVREDDRGMYLQATTFESFTDGDQVVPAAEALIVRLNGIFSLGGGYQSDSFSGRVERDDSAWVSDAARLVDVALTADGVVIGADGVVKSSPGPSHGMRQLQAADDHPAVAEAYRIHGLKPSPSWNEFYKVYEVLREACGGRESDLSERTGVSQRRIEKLTATSNHRLLSGDEARHAAMKGTPSPKRKITKDEGRAIVQNWSRVTGPPSLSLGISSGGTLVPLECPRPSITSRRQPQHSKAESSAIRRPSVATRKRWTRS